MKKIQLLTLLITLAAACGSISAQPNKKVQPALHKFLNTEFMIKYRDLRISSESTVLRVQSNQGALKQPDLFKLRSAYDQTATRANQLLDNIKQDFLNGKKLKTIAEFPDMYSDGLRYKLQELSDFYSANFQQALADAEQVDEVDGGAILLLLVELIGLSKGLVDYFGDIKREARLYSETYLQEHLVQPYRWRYWDELAGSISPYEQFDKNSELPLETVPNDALDQKFQQLNQTIDQLPAKNPNNTWEDEPGYDPTGANPDSSSNFRYDDWSPTETTPDSSAIKPTPKKVQNKPGATVVNPAQKATKKADPSKPNQF